MSRLRATNKLLSFKQYKDDNKMYILWFCYRYTYMSWSENSWKTTL